LEGASGDEPLIVEQREAGWSAAVGALALESGEQRPASARLPGDLPLGWHRLVHTGGERRLVVAPDGCHLLGWLACGGRGWATQRCCRAVGASANAKLRHLRYQPVAPDPKLEGGLSLLRCRSRPRRPRGRRRHEPTW